MRKLLLAAVLLGASSLRATTAEIWVGPWLPWPTEDLGRFYLSIIPQNPPGAPDFLEAPDNDTIPLPDPPSDPEAGLGSGGGPTGWTQLQPPVLERPPADGLAAVPEPASFILLLSAVFAAGLL